MLPRPRHVQLIELWIIVKGRRFNVLIMIALHVIAGNVGDGVHPLGAHLVDGRTSFPVSRIGLLRSKDERKGDRSDENANGVGMRNVSIRVRAVAPDKADDEKENDGKGAGDHGAIGRRTVDSEQKVETKGRAVVFNHRRLFAVCRGEEGSGGLCVRAKTKIRNA